MSFGVSLSTPPSFSAFAWAALSLASAPGAGSYVMLGAWIEVLGLLGGSEDSGLLGGNAD